jgi:hypothetical protein
VAGRERQGGGAAHRLPEARHLGVHAHSEDDIPYVRRRYLTPQIAQDVANATFTVWDVEL